MTPPAAKPPAADEPDSPIEVCLDELLSVSRALAPRQIRELIAEAEAHLRDDAEAAQAGGMTAFDAETQAVAHFGPVSVVASAEYARGVTPIGALARQVLLTGLLLGGVGAIAVGVSGVLAAIVRAAGGTRLLVGVPAQQVLSASNCGRWLANDPLAGNCRTAAASDWATETVVYRIAFGVLGVLALVAFRWIIGHRRHPYGATLLPTVSDTIAVTAFGAAGVWTLGLGIDAIVSSSGDGSGQWLSAAPIALAAATFYATRLVSRVRRPLDFGR